MYIHVIHLKPLGDPEQDKMNQPLKTKCHFAQNLLLVYCMDPDLDTFG